MALTQSSCDADVENCDGSASDVVRPGVGALASLTFLYLGQVASPVLVFLIILILFGNSELNAGLELLFIFLPSYLGFFAYYIPFVVSVFYMIFGANFFLIRWVDNFLVFLIYHFVSNITPLLHGLTLFVVISTFSDVDWNAIHLTTLGLQTLSGLYFWYQTANVSIEAIQHVDPYWLKVAPGPLWPSIAYFFGADRGLNDPEDTDKKSDDKEISDGIITLSLLTF